MPVRRRIDKRREEVTDQHEAWLRGADIGCGLIPYSPREELATLWAAHSDRIVTEHVTLYPGTRPARFWQYEAVDPRQRLGGIGTPAWEALSYKPIYSRGLPAVWITLYQIRYYSGIAVDINGAPIGDLYPSNFRGVAIDPNDLPTFESQATYLKRLGLFLVGEERRLRKADWEPESVSKTE
jgi:hypothetical protein